MAATCLGVAPYAGIKFGSYEALKGALGQVASVEEKDLQPWQRVAAGAIAGLIAQTVVYPLDVVRRRMQVRVRVGANPNPNPNPDPDPNPNPNPSSAVFGRGVNVPSAAGRP